MKTIDMLAEKILFPTLLSTPIMVPGGLWLHYLDNHTSISNFWLAVTLLAVMGMGSALGHFLTRKIAER